MEKDTNFNKLLELPLEQYQQELGRLLVAAINIASEEIPEYAERLDKQKREVDELKCVVVK